MNLGRTLFQTQTLTRLVFLILKGLKFLSLKGLGFIPLQRLGFLGLKRGQSYSKEKTYVNTKKKGKGKTYVNTKNKGMGRTYVNTLKTIKSNAATLKRT